MTWSRTPSLSFCGDNKMILEFTVTELSRGTREPQQSGVVGPVEEVGEAVGQQAATCAFDG